MHKSGLFRAAGQFSGSILLAWIMLAGSIHARPQIDGCGVFPSDNIWNTPIDGLPVDPKSSAYVATIGADKVLHPDFGSGLWDGGPIGIPYTTVASAQAGVDISFNYFDESDPGPYPIPADAPIEGGDHATGDRHVLVLEKDNCILYELYAAYPQDDGSWYAGSGAVFDLKEHSLRPDGWTSADAAGLPILPGLVRYDEVASGEIRHALRFTAPQTQRHYVWPARHFASSLTGSDYPPMGQRFRLKKEFDISGFSPQVRVILQALKTYGMFLADNGSSWFLSGVPDERWDNDMLRELRQLTGAVFEAVDQSGLRLDADSGQALDTRRRMLLGAGSGSAGWIEVVEAVLPNGHVDWIRVDWDAYNAAVGETRPVFCNLDSDPGHEIVIGLGSYPENGGWIEIKDDLAAGYQHLAWLQVGWPEYNAANGETWPACGDFDHDGRDEIAIGLGTGGDGWVRMIDDAASGFSPLDAMPAGSGWVRFNWPDYNVANGEVRPSAGNLDADAAEELVLAPGTDGAGWVQILDDASQSFAVLSGTPFHNGWLRFGWPTYNTQNGELWPAVCDLDGNGVGELVLGAGSGGQGWAQVFDADGGYAPVVGAPFAGGWMRLPWAQYNEVSGALYPACGDLDGDADDELVMGLGSHPENGGWLFATDDLPSGLDTLAWLRFGWPSYNAQNGAARATVEP